MSQCAYICYKCMLLVKRRPTSFMFLILSAILVHAIVAVYIILCCKHGPSINAPYYVLGSNGRSFHDIDYSNSRIYSTCLEKTNFVFVKGMKCATSTLLNVFYRFGYTRNLSFVLPVKNKIYLNWPFPMTKFDIRPSSVGYNILVDHAIFTETVMAEIMPADTLYLSIIREPFDHFKSVFQYFNIFKIAGVPVNLTDPFTEYFQNIKHYETKYTSHNARNRWCIPDGFHISKNLMSHCHGMSLGFPSNTKDISNDNTAVDRYLKYLDTKFSLIMIVEHFYESIILLRRLMCWAFKDILFIRSNVAKYDFDVTKIGQHVTEIHRNWSSVDYKLYDHFNRTLWKRISEQGPKFFEEVSEFKSVQIRVNAYCQSIYKLGKISVHPMNMSELVVLASPWTEKFAVLPADCWMLDQGATELRKKLQEENDAKEMVLLAESMKSEDKRDLNIKGLC